MPASITTWSRLEPLDQSTDLDASLSAPIADPLWLLHRQWQLGELEANDAGSPIAVTVTRAEAALSGFRAADPRGTTGTRRAYDPAAMPLEPLIEAERRSEEHTSELQSRPHLVCRLLLEKKKQNKRPLVHSSKI